jgi:predicted nuclease of restriction endonuclease-like RecB superfamily
LHAIEKATQVLPPELRRKAFMLAARISKATQEMCTIEILESLASKLLIEKEIVQKTIDSTVKTD